MRKVTVEDLAQFQRTIKEIELATAKWRETLQQGNAQFLAMANSGQLDDAVEVATRLQAQGATEMAKLGVRFEESTVAFLGERRGVLESLDSYSERIMRVMTSGNWADVFAMQCRNGLQFHLTSGIAPTGAQS